MNQFSHRLLLGVAAYLLAANPVSADTFNGNFVNDYDYQFIKFTVVSDNTLITAETTSWANNDGFDPYLTLLDNNGHVLNQNDDKDISDPNPANWILDAYIQQSLNAGVYWIAISQFTNPVDSTNNNYYTPTTVGTHDGFVQTIINYTDTIYDCSNNQFCSFDLNTFDNVNKSSFWALTLSNVTNATVENGFNPPPAPPLPPQPPAVPEPGSLALMSIGLSLLAKKTVNRATKSRS